METGCISRKRRAYGESVEAIKATFKGGNVFIPSFAIGRTQDLLYILNNLVRREGYTRLMSIFDSPLAEDATRGLSCAP